MYLKNLKKKKAKQKILIISEEDSINKYLKY